MREFVVSEAPLGRVATLARATIEEAGGVVAQHTETTTEFDHLQEDEDDWSRSGYVGTYKRYREDPVQLRIRVWASWPRRLFHGAVWLGLVEAVLFFTLSIVQVPPPPNAWIVSAILTFAFLGLAFLLYATSWADSADLEDEIARKLTARLRDDEEVDGDVYTVGEWEEHRQDVIEQAVAEAERKAPERPSKASQIAGSVAQAGKGKAGALLQRVRSDDDDEEEHPPEADEPEDESPEPEEEPGEDDGEDVDPELAAKRERLEELKREKQESEDEQSGGLLDRIPFLGSGDDEDDGDEPTDEPEEEPAQADEPEEDEDDGSSFTDWLPFIGSSDEDDAGDEPTDEPEKEPAQADEPEADEGDGSSDEPDEDAGDATGDEEAAEPEPEAAASDEADADAGAAPPEEPDAPEPEPAAEGDAEAEEVEPPATGEDEDDEER